MQRKMLQASQHMAAGRQGAARDAGDALEVCAEKGRLLVKRSPHDAEGAIVSGLVLGIVTAKDPEGGRKVLHITHLPLVARFILLGSER
jgi:hypothetical protein